MVWNRLPSTVQLLEVYIAQYEVRIVALDHTCSSICFQHKNNIGLHVAYIAIIKTAENTHQGALPDISGEYVQAPKPQYADL